ncbi:MAG TPA: carboxy terminal-processing peptidase [Flavisolibacter sp.]|nr:carboxy terminal-processing peptidase [Flavisolibacter sp.]
MRKILSLLLLHSLASPLYAQIDLVPVQQKLIKELTAKKHIAPKPLDDKFSADFYQTFLNTLDEDRLFFTAPDLKKLETFRSAIDDEWNNGTVNFFTAAAQLYKAKLLAAKTMITEICAKPFDFSLTDVYNFSDTTTAATDKALFTRWNNLLKADVLQSLMNIARNQWQTKNAIAKTEVLAKEPEMRSRVKTKHLNLINGLLEPEADYQQQLTGIYLNTFLNCLDPHSTFFDAAARQNFKEGLNTEGLSFGFSLDENERGEVFIDHLAPGGAAWTSGLLNKGDVPVQLKWEGGQPVELAGLEIDDVYRLLNLHTKEKMELTVRKGNGQQQTVILQKQKLQNEENIVKSFVLSGRQNIGYVMLPSFYTEWEDRSGSRCAADVAKEIVKLKKDSIAGLILDLRFNGGGSLAEAVEMAGIFIDEGAICQIKTSGEAKLEVLKDMNRGVIYNGPMLVLVNGQSASASELVAAALQDYNRAIIAGTPTYGKATGQNILPLQEGSGDKNGFLKLTTMKLFRSTGKTAQKAGVQPDIIIPDVYGLEQREADEPFALGADTVAAYKYFKPMKPLSIVALQQKSSSRIAETPKFREGKRLAQLASGYRKKGRVSLKWEDAEKDLKSITSGIDEKFFSQPSSVYRVRNNTPDQKFTAASSNEMNNFWLKRLAADMYVEEAFQILADLIQTQ